MSDIDLSADHPPPRSKKISNPNIGFRTFTSRQVRRFTDRFATVIVTAGGLATIFSIFGIFLYLFIEVAPLFYGASVSQKSGVESGVIQEHSSALQRVAVGVDEYMEVGYLLHKGQPFFYDLSTEKPISLPSSPHLERVLIEEIVRSGSKGHDYAFGTREGLVYPVAIRFSVKYQDSSRTVHPRVSVEQPIQVIPSGSLLKKLAYQVTEIGMVFAAVTTSNNLWITKIEEKEGLFIEEGESQFTQFQVEQKSNNEVSALLLDRLGENLTFGSTSGSLFYWNIADSDIPRFIGSYSVKTRGDSVSSLAYLIGDRSIVVGTVSGDVSVWMPFRDPNIGGDAQLRYIRSFQSHPARVTAISPSQRDKGFLTADEQGNIFIHHSTSSQTIVTVPGQGKSIQSLMSSPKGDGAVAIDSAGELQIFRIDNEHPETTLATLFTPVVYEGYSEPHHIWQSSSGSDDFEPKFGLWPLIFGTLKGTFYAMLLATPLAVLGAIYTAMFMNPNVRTVVKPIVEIMEALPTVVLGFLAGLWLAPLLESIFPGVVAIFLILPFAILIVTMIWYFLPGRLVKNSGGWLELSTILLTIVTVVGVCLSQSVLIESFIFDGNYKAWLQGAFGVAYDQRNALVIAFAMGMAVIPTIFSISEDALSNVPRHLIAGSLAMGATPWQTLTHLIIISASPGLFSALMIGLGRVVGETMIVLMATGNTPLMDMNLFNGFRTLSANIAVEMPEAPHGGTLYRLLFLSALILFAFTTVVNTIAEIVRQRLRARYSQF